MTEQFPELCNKSVYEAAYSAAFLFKTLFNLKPVQLVAYNSFGLKFFIHVFLLKFFK